MSDSYFIGTVSRIHNLWRFARPNLPPDPKSPLRRIAAMEAAEIREGARGIMEGRVESSVGMMVSLDHTIYFHRPRDIRADEWLCTEMESPWAGQGRGLVFQRIWNRRGDLVASCVQEVSYISLCVLGAPSPNFRSQLSIITFYYQLGCGMVTLLTREKLTMFVFSVVCGPCRPYLHTNSLLELVHLCRHIT